MSLFASRHLDTRVGRLWIQEAGSGPALIFLHGILSESSSWHGVAPAFADRHRVILIDGPGHGQSEAAPAGLTLEAYADALAEVLDALGVADAVLVGLSLGGMAAQRLAIRHPGRVRGLVLLGTTADGPPLPVRVRFWVTGRLVGVFGMPRAIRLSLRRLVFPKPFIEANPEAMAALAVSYRTWDARKTARIFDGLFAIQGIREQLKAVQAPTLVMVGELDRVAPPVYSEGIAASIPGARLLVLPEVGHVVPMEAPDRFVAELTAFLAPLAGAG